MPRTPRIEQKTLNGNPSGLHQPFKKKQAKVPAFFKPRDDKSSSEKIPSLVPNIPLVAEPLYYTQRKWLKAPFCPESMEVPSSESDTQNTSLGGESRRNRGSLYTQPRLLTPFNRESIKIPSSESDTQGVSLGGESRLYTQPKWLRNLHAYFKPIVEESKNDNFKNSHSESNSPSFFAQPKLMSSADDALEQSVDDCKKEEPFDYRKYLNWDYLNLNDNEESECSPQAMK